jgi:hypothetical protein
MKSIDEATAGVHGHGLILSVPTKLSGWLRGDRVVPFAMEVVFGDIDGAEFFF